jgi:hypothetical protein
MKDYINTPGNWEIIDGDTRGDKVYWVTIGGGGKIIAEVFGYNWGEVHKNAELMAASPELFSLVEKCLKSLEDLNIDLGLQDELRTVISKVMDDKREDVTKYE